MQIANCHEPLELGSALLIIILFYKMLIRAQHVWKSWLICPFSANFFFFFGWKKYNSYSSVYT